MNARFFVQGQGEEAVLRRRCFLPSCGCPDATRGQRGFQHPLPAPLPPEASGDGVCGRSLVVGILLHPQHLSLLPAWRPTRALEWAPGT